MFEGLVRRGTLVTVALLIVCVLGIVAAFRIPVQMIPDLEVRTISVRTSWPGATPQDIEQEILIEQEEYLRNIPGLEKLEATASSGQASIELEFPYDVDITQAMIRVNNALSQVPSYPDNVNEPSVDATSFSQNSFMYFRVQPLDGNPRGLDLTMMRDFLGDHVRPRMESVPGVAEAAIWGGSERRIRIDLDPARLTERYLSVADVRDAIRARNRDVSGGDLEAGKRRYLLRTVGRFSEVQQLEQLVLARRGDAITRLGEVADIELSHREPDQRSWVNGEPSITVGIYRQPGSNVMKIKDGLVAAMDDINREVLNPAGMKMRLTADDVTYVSDSLTNVWRNLGIGAVLALGVMFLFLRSPRATWIAVMGVPVCAIAGFLGLLVAGRTVNVISLAGIAFAIGMTLDNSIVVLESIELERRKGLDKVKAAVAGVQKVWPAVLASTLTTVLVFVPIVFIQEEAGQLYSDIAIAVSAAILASMLVAITVVPAAAARFDVHGGSGRGRLGPALAAGVGRLIATWPRRLAVMAGTVAASAAIVVFLTPPASYLPEGEEPKTFATMNAPPGYNLERMTEIAQEIEAEFLPHVGADGEAYAKGETDIPPLAYLSLSAEASNMRIIAETQDPGHIRALMDAITERYEQYPGMRAFAARGSIITSNDGGTRSVNLDVSGTDLPAIYRTALTAYRRAQAVFDDPRIQATPSTLSLSQPLVEVRPDWNRAAELGLDARELGAAVATLGDGAYADEFFLGDDKLDIYLNAENGLAGGPDALDDMPVHTRNGTTVPLADVARIVETVNTSTLRRVNGQRTVTLNIIPPDEVPLEVGVQRVREEVVGHLRQRGEIPAQVGVEITGAADELQRTQEALWSNYLVAIAVVYLLLVAIFSHWGHPLLIMTAIPLGVAGGILGLKVMNVVGGALPAIGLPAIHQPFDMISMLGFLILMGTVVNNPILLVHRAQANLRAGETDVRAAVQEAVASRLRPIAMSTITTIVGLAPLVFIPGAGTELYRGVGAIVLFGIMGAAVVTLTFLPALTASVLRARARPA
ncbi:Multidrug efflux pump subunit AcrB [Limimonas halophila]|uniref:Multidrug efflux pump subunit AcrB n=1 Tax=Limimonas halophila TaxID=1082479 RepID=A0A1G7RI71_9PROT|nr:efflux RND transporter permease subunit [Limimonas halophila]SDG10412.1 Multidrug efflux pump subunit AcrB [Limimonas halophila]